MGLCLKVGASHTLGASPMSNSSPMEPARVTGFTLESCVRAFDLLGIFDQPSSPKRQLILGTEGILYQVQQGIGRQLRAEYDVGLPMPAQLVELLRQVEQPTADPEKGWQAT